MIVQEAKINELDAAVDLAFGLQKKIETRCRPLLLNVSREKLYNEFMHYITQEEKALLLVKECNDLVGVSPIYWISEDCYVAFSQGPYGYDYEVVANCLYHYVMERFKGYTLYVNTAKEHTASQAFYLDKDFSLEEVAVMLKLEDFESDYRHSNVQGLSEENNIVLFDWIDKYCDETTYWNSKRMRRKLDRFIILGYFDEDIKGHIVGRGSDFYTEVIAWSGENEVKEILLKSFITEASKKGVNFIDLYTEEVDESSMGERVGFELYDNNMCYIKKLV